MNLWLSKINFNTNFSQTHITWLDEGKSYYKTKNDDLLLLLFFKSVKCIFSLVYDILVWSILTLDQQVIFVKF